jgi:hypothetical protein
MVDGYEVVDLGFTFKYFDRDYTQLSISTNGYVCLGNNSKCDSFIILSSNDILVGLNHWLNTKRVESGQIYFKHLDSNLSDLGSSKIYLNLFDPDFEPENTFMITYDNVLAYYPSSSTSRTSFQIFLSSSDSVNKKSFVLFKFTSCPTDLNLRAPPGLRYKKNDGIPQIVKISDGQHCTGSNVGQTGVWVSDVKTSSGN